mgnify:FL=1
MEISDADWDHADPFFLDRLVSENDVDELLHTNNTVYVHWCQEAAWAHSKQLGLDIERYKELDRAMAITYSEYRYLRASNVGDKVKIGTWIVSWDRKLTMKREFQIIREDGATLLRGAMHFACIEISTGKPRRLPKEFIEGYGPAVIV